jgi:hypothetical protein
MTRIRTAIDAKIAAKLHFAYSPKSCNQGTCLNICGTNKTKVAQQGVLRGVKVVKVTDIKESIRYIGGAKAPSFFLHSY